MQDHYILFILIFAYLTVINMVAFLSFYIDKKLAQSNERRIAESTLLGLAFFGGSLGSIIAQQKFRHKTRKQPFKSQLYTIAALHLVLIIVLIIPNFRSEFLKLIQF